MFTAITTLSAFQFALYRVEILIALIRRLFGFNFFHTDICMGKMSVLNILPRPASRRQILPFSIYNDQNILDKKYFEFLFFCTCSFFLHKLFTQKHKRSRIINIFCFNQLLRLKCFD